MSSQKLASDALSVYAKCRVALGGLPQMALASWEPLVDPCPWLLLVFLLAALLSPLDRECLN